LTGEEQGFAAERDMRSRLICAGQVAYSWRERGASTEEFGNQEIGLASNPAPFEFRLNEGRMENSRKILGIWLAALFLFSAATLIRAGQGQASPERQLKLRQKEERRAFKLRKKQAMFAAKGPQFTKAVRLRTKHEWQRQERELRERQKNELEDLKDKQKIRKEYEKSYTR